MRRFWSMLILALLLSCSVRAQERENVRLSTTWRAAEVEGRTLWVSEQSVALRTDARTELQVGWQRFVAKGKVRTNRFSTTARWYGVERLLQVEGERQVKFSWRRLEGGEGVADVAEGLFTYVAPRVETAELVVLQNGQGATQGYRLSYSRTRAGTERAETFGLALYTAGVSAGRALVTLEGAVYADRHRGDAVYRSVFTVEAALPLGRNLQARLGGAFAPKGFPAAGTPVEGLTAFTVYRPGSLVESWRDRSAGYLNLQVVLVR